MGRPGTWIAWYTRLRSALHSSLIILYGRVFVHGGRPAWSQIGGPFYILHPDSHQYRHATLHHNPIPPSSPKGITASANPPTHLCPVPQRRVLQCRQNVIVAESIIPLLIQLINQPILRLAVASPSASSSATVPAAAADALVASSAWETAGAGGGQDDEEVLLTKSHISKLQSRLPPPKAYGW